MVSSAQKRRAASSVVDAGRCSGRQACRYLGLGRSTWHYTPLPATARAVQLERAILQLSHAHPRHGREQLELGLRQVDAAAADPGFHARHVELDIRADADDFRG